MRAFATANNALSNALETGADESVLQHLEESATAAFRRLVSETSGGFSVH